MSKYCEVLVKKAYDFASSEWYTDKEVCHYLGINRDTFYRWKKTKPAFAEAMEDARRDLHNKAFTEARKSLLRLLKGYYYYETVEECTPQPNGSFIVTKVIVKKKYQPPNVPAIIYASEKYEPETFGDRKVVSGEVRIVNNPDNLRDKYKINIEEITGMEVI